MAILWFAKALQILILLLILVAGFGQAVLQLWNWLMPDDLRAARDHVSGRRSGLMALCWILFGGLRGGRTFQRGWRHSWEGRWQRMTPEERERFRKGFEGRCGPPGRGTEARA